MTRPDRLVPLVVASPMFLQNIDTAAMATALPSMAAALQVPLLHLNLVVMSYLVSIAVFLPLSAWLAERVGARRLFCTAILLFCAASTLCGLAGSLGALLACRVLQGLGAALMLPVGRLILLRSVPATAMVAAMTWFTVPPVLGRLLGPLLAGVVLSVASWPWIFFVHVPLGLLAVGLALRVVDKAAPTAPPPPFDLRGFVLLGAGLGALLLGLETAGKALVSHAASAAAALFGVAALAAYGWHWRRVAHPVLDLGILRLATFRINLLGAVPLRLALFAAPFLLPLMLQIGFGLSPLVAGALAAAAGLGALSTRAFMRPALTRFGFRRLMLVGTAATACSYMAYALFRPHTPVVLMFAVLFTSGVLSSLCMVSLNTLAFMDVPPAQRGHAAAFSSVLQQLTAGGAVVLAGGLLGLFVQARGGAADLQWPDFAASFVALGVLALLSMPAFRRLPPDVGNGLR